MNIVLVDDEQGARNVLRNLLDRSNFPTIIKAEFQDLKSAVAYLEQNQEDVDVVFLDVDMPNYAGYEIADLMENINFDIVFATAYDQYAIKAFELSAVDYLLKPINRLRLNETLEKLLQSKQKKEESTAYKRLLLNIRDQELTSITVNEVGQSHIFSFDEIIAIEAQGAYSKIHLINRDPFTASKHLRYFDEKLSDVGPFFRSHKSWLINTNHLMKNQHNSAELILKCQVVARLSRYKKDALKELI